jgi:hypothetical protein
MAETKRMTAEQVVSYLLEGEEGLDFLRESLRWVVGQLMEAEVSELIGAEHGERNPDRLANRNGYRPRRWDTRAGEIELAGGFGLPAARELSGRIEESFLQRVQKLPPETQRALLVAAAEAVGDPRVIAGRRAARSECRRHDSRGGRGTGGARSASSLPPPAREVSRVSRGDAG